MERVQRKHRKIYVVKDGAESVLGYLLLFSPFYHQDKGKKKESSNRAITVRMWFFSQVWARRQQRLQAGCGFYHRYEMFVFLEIRNSGDHRCSSSLSSRCEVFGSQKFRNSGNHSQGVVFLTYLKYSDHRISVTTAITAGVQFSHRCETSKIFHIKTSNNKKKTSSNKSCPKGFNNVIMKKRF